MRSLAGRVGRRRRGGGDVGALGGGGEEELPPHPASFPLQCAAHKLCHPEELVLLGHSLGIPQAPLSSCSSQSLELVSPEGRREMRGREGRLTWKAPQFSRLHAGALRGASQAMSPDSPIRPPRQVAWTNCTAASFSTRASCRPWRASPQSWPPPWTHCSWTSPTLPPTSGCR